MNGHSNWKPREDTLNTDTTIYKDVQSKVGVTDKMISDYLKVFEKLHLIDEISAWNPNIVSKTAIHTCPRKMPILQKVPNPKELVRPKHILIIHESMVTEILFIQNQKMLRCHTIETDTDFKVI